MKLSSDEETKMFECVEASKHTLIYNVYRLLEKMFKEIDKFEQTLYKAYSKIGLDYLEDGSAETIENIKIMLEQAIDSSEQELGLIMKTYRNKLNEL